MSLKESCALIVAAIMAAFAWRYGIKIRRREIEPPLSTWILFLVGVAVSLLFYGLEEEYVIRAFVLVLILITFCFMTTFELRARRRSEAG